MKKEVSFCTNLFESKEVKPHFINDNCFGEDLARWLVYKLSESKFSFSEPYQEDWGWEINAKAGKENFFIQIGIVHELIDLDDAEWLISVEPVRGWFSFRKNNSELTSELCNEINKVLQTEKKITQIQWQD